jgi:hypothetical protein
VPKRRAALATGVLHGLFHLPIILLTTAYDSVGKRYIVAPIVVVTIAHNAANTMFDLGAASVMTTSPLALAYTAGESRVATLVVVAGLAVLLLTRASTLRDAESPDPRTPAQPLR